MGTDEMGELIGKNVCQEHPTEKLMRFVTDSNVLQRIMLTGRIFT